MYMGLFKHVNSGWNLNSELFKHQTFRRKRVTLIFGDVTVISVDIEFKCCLIAFRQAFIILDASMDRHCQKSAWCQLYSSISNLTSVTNEVRYCVFCGNKTSQYIESSARPHCSSQPPAKYFISEPLDGSVSVKLFSFERRITMPARQQTNKNLK